ncbi:MAG: DUF4007 family protein [Candidatus Gastranaerophilaceae bacterium]
MTTKEKKLETIGKTEGFYPKINHFQKMMNDDITGAGKTQLKALKFWQSVIDVEVLENDPYLEKKSTILKLHNQVLKLPLADFFFNKFKQIEFTEEELINAAVKEFSETSKSAIQRDIKAILKMYAEHIPENPFFDLYLLSFDGKNYRK